MPYLLNSDIASEMVLSNILSEKNCIITDLWYYSTELRVLNTQLIYSLFFHFTDNWHTVRLLSIAVLQIILTFSTLYLCRQTGCWHYGPLVASAMLLPLSIQYFNIVVMGCFYIPHIVISFITVGLCISFSKNKGKRQIIIATVSALLAFLSCLGGIRQVVITYFPLLISTLIISAVFIIKNSFASFKASTIAKYVIISLINIIFSGVGYLINHMVLAEKYSFSDYSDINFTGINAARISELVNDILFSLGYTQGKINTVSLISNCICAVIVLLVIYSIVHGIKDKVSAEYKMLTVFYICNLAVFLLIYIMTDMGYSSRYNLPVIVFSFPLIAVALKETNFERLPRFTGSAVVVFCTGLIFLRGFFVMLNVKTVNRIGELETVANFLCNSDYDNGYATFWNANIITELTNGKEEMYAWGDSTPDGKSFINTNSVNVMYSWLQETEHISTPPSGKVFALYTVDEIKHCNWKHYLKNSDVIYSGNNFIVYGYDDYETMINVLHDTIIEP